MYLISKEDLQIVIDNCFDDDYIFNFDDFKDLLSEYGEAWFMVDGQFSLVNESEPMKKLKEKVDMK
jgi:hypothetical protein